MAGERSIGALVLAGRSTKHLVPNHAIRDSHAALAHLIS